MKTILGLVIVLATELTINGQIFPSKSLATPQFVEDKTNPLNHQSPLSHNAN